MQPNMQSDFLALPCPTDRLSVYLDADRIQARIRALAERLMPYMPIVLGWW